MDLPIALRRTRRSTSSSSLSAAFHDAASTARDDMPTPPLTPSASSPSSADSGPSTPSSRKTPSRRGLSTRKRDPKSKSKRVRFSDPGLTTAPSSPSSCNCSSGLTPFIRRTSLQTGLPVSGDVSFLPLRQVLDGRVQRRLRRNGLSEEMNNVFAEKKERRKRAEEAEKELARLRAEVAAKDQLIQRLGHSTDIDNVTIDDVDVGDDTIIQDNERVMALQREVNMLRRQLNRGEEDDDIEDPSVDARPNWTMAARDPFASTMSIDYARDNDDDMTEVMSDAGNARHYPSPRVIDVDGADIFGFDGHDGGFGDATMAELQSSTPIRRRTTVNKRPHGADFDSQMTVSFAQSSFPTPPATSPLAWDDDADVGLSTRPTTPTPDRAAATTATPVTPSMHFFSTRRVIVSPVSSPIPTPSAVRVVDTEVQAALIDPEMERLQTQVATLLRDLADKTAALEVLSEGLQALSPSEDTDRPVDASDIVARLATAFRTARLELEYLTPGEIELPLAAPAAAVLDLLLTKLRDLAQQVIAADAQIDEYHALEGDLRQQLGARVQAMDDLVKEGADKTATIAAQKTAIAAHESTIADLRLGADRFKGALASYARDVQELEALVNKLEAALKEKEATITDNEKTLSAKEKSLEETRAKLVELRRLSRSAAATHGQALALRDARVHELRGEIEERDAALRATQRRGHESARQLREDNALLKEKLEAETQRATAAKAAVATLQTLLDGPSTGSEGAAATETRKEKRMSLGRRLFGKRASGGSDGFSSVSSASSASTDSTAVETTEATPRSTKKRRRYDSGLGFLDEEAEAL